MRYLRRPSHAAAHYVLMLVQTTAIAPVSFISILGSCARYASQPSVLSTLLGVRSSVRSVMQLVDGRMRMRRRRGPSLAPLKGQTSLRRRRMRLGEGILGFCVRT